MPLHREPQGRLVTNGNPLYRPGDLSRCHNLRPMDGNRQWWRLAGGTKARHWGGGGAGSWRQWHEYYDPVFGGWPNHLGQWTDPGGSPKAKWVWVALSNWTQIDVEPIATNYDNDWSVTNPAAVCNLRNRVIIYNGLGVRDPATGSRPPFSSYYPDSNTIEYFGLDLYPRGGVPVGSQIAGSINNAGVRRFGVGLYNDNTGHFSNGYPLTGSLPVGSSNGYRFSSLSTIRPAVHSPGVEEGRLYFVFYVTLNDGEVYYLIMDPATNYTQPVRVPVTNSSYDLTTLTDIMVDFTKEMPFANHPPRPMRDICVANGRMYGVLMPGGAMLGGEASFNYVSASRYHCGLVYSAAQGPETEFLGSPEDSWPLTNFTACPSAEIPLKIDESPDGNAVLAVTGTRTFVVNELADGTHHWDKKGWFTGIRVPATYTRTAYGSFWVTQNNEFALMTATGELRILSRKFQQLMRGETPLFSTYVLDPENQVDQVEVHLASGKAVCWDFALSRPHTKASTFTAGKTLRNYQNRTYHLLSNNSIYTQHGQPEDGLEPNKLQIYDGLGTVVKSQIVGELDTQYTAGASGLDSLKQVESVRVYGDRNNLTLSAMIGQEQISSEAVLAHRERDTSPSVRFKFPVALAAIMYRLYLRLFGPLGDEPGDTLPPLETIMDQTGTGVGHVVQGTVLDIVVNEPVAGKVQ